jgi:hypothetical protein
MNKSDLAKHADEERAMLRRQAYAEYQSRVQAAMRWYERELENIDNLRELRLSNQETT